MNIQRVLLSLILIAPCSITCTQLSTSDLQKIRNVIDKGKYEVLKKLKKETLVAIIAKQHEGAKDFLETTMRLRKKEQTMRSIEDEYITGGLVVCLFSSFVAGVSAPLFVSLFSKQTNKAGSSLITPGYTMLSSVTLSIAAGWFTHKILKPCIEIGLEAKRVQNRKMLDELHKHKVYFEEPEMKEWLYRHLYS